MQNISAFLRCVAIALTVMWGAGASSPAQAQTWYNNRAGVKVSVVPTEKSLLVDVLARATSAAEIIEQIALKTNMDIAVLNDAPVSFIALKEVSPAVAVAEVAQAAGLSSELAGRTYIIRKLAEPPKKNSALEIFFKDIAVKDLLSVLKENFEIKLEVAPQVAGRLAVIHLTENAPQLAVEKIAQAAQLSFEVTRDGVYRIGFEDAIAP